MSGQMLFQHLTCRLGAEIETWFLAAFGFISRTLASGQELLHDVWWHKDAGMLKWTTFWRCLKFLMSAVFGIFNIRGVWNFSAVLEIFMSWVGRNLLHDGWWHKDAGILTMRTFWRLRGSAASKILYKYFWVSERAFGHERARVFQHLKCRSGAEIETRILGHFTKFSERARTYCTMFGCIKVLECWSDHILAAFRRVFIFGGVWNF